MVIFFFNNLAKKLSIHFFLLLSFFTRHILNLAKALQCFEKPCPVLKFVLKFAECYKFTTAVDLNIHDLYNFAFLSFELRLSRVSCVVSGLARTDPHVSLNTHAKKRKLLVGATHPIKAFFFQFIRGKVGEILSRFSLIMSVALDPLYILTINFSPPIVIIKFCSVISEKINVQFNF